MWSNDPLPQVVVPVVVLLRMWYLALLMMLLLPLLLALLLLVLLLLLLYVVSINLYVSWWQCICLSPQAPAVLMSPPFSKPISCQVWAHQLMGSHSLMDEEEEVKSWDMMQLCDHIWRSLLNSGCIFKVIPVSSTNCLKLRIYLYTLL